MTWAERNEVYRRRGAAKAIRYNHRWERDLLEQNKGKVGRPFKYSDSMMSFIALWKATVGESYRDCSGYLGKAFGEDRAPDYTTVWRRTGNAMPVFEHDPQFTLKEGVLRVAVDSTGIANSNRGEWIRVRWNVKRGFFKLHVLVDLDTRRILAFALSDMNGGDAAHLPLLLNQLMKGCTGEGIPLKESVAKIVIDKIPRAGGTDPPPDADGPMDRRGRNTRHGGAGAERRRAESSGQRAGRQTEAHLQQAEKDGHPHRAEGRRRIRRQIRVHAAGQSRHHAHNQDTGKRQRQVRRRGPRPGPGRAGTAWRGGETAPTKSSTI